MDAVRKRVQRGTIEHEKDAAGRVHILLDSPDDASTVRDESPDATGHAALIDAKEETISELRERVKRLEHELDIRNEEVRRRDHLLAAALERIPAIEPPEPQDAPTETAEPSGSGEGRAESEDVTERRGLWRRWFGGRR